jgi:hypothetical protein
MQYAPSIAHYGVLAGGFVILLYASRNQGFYFDDWSFLIPGVTDFWQPHNGHWSTIPRLIFVVLRNAFGLREFTPFVLPDLLAHLAIAHLIWRLMLRSGVERWIATSCSALVVFLGAGWENILWAFQVGFLGAVALALLSLLLIARDHLGWQSRVVIVLCSLLSVLFSGTALPVLAAVTIVGLVRQGWRWTAVLLAPTAVAFLAWYVLVGRSQPSLGSPQRLRDVLIAVPEYVLTMLLRGFGNMFPLAASLGLALAVVLAVFAVVSAFRLTPERLIPLALLAAALVFALMTAFSRVALGLSAALSPRYVYLVCVFGLPFAALALSGLVRRSRVAVAVACVAVLIVTVHNGQLLRQGLNSRAVVVQAAAQNRAAAVSLINAHPERYPSDLVVDRAGSGYVTVGVLKEYERLGWLPRVPFAANDELNVRAYMDVVIEAAEGDPKVALSCSTPGAGGADYVAVPADGLYVHADASSAVLTRAVTTSAIGAPATWQIGAGWSKISPRDIGDHLQVTTTQSNVEICLQSRP